MDLILPFMSIGRLAFSSSNINGIFLRTRYRQIRGLAEVFVSVVSSMTLTLFFF